MAAVGRIAALIKAAQPQISNQGRLSDRVDEKTTVMTVRKIPHTPAARPGRRRSKRPPRRHRNGFKRTAALDEHLIPDAKPRRLVSVLGIEIVSASSSVRLGRCSPTPYAGRRTATCRPCPQRGAGRPAGDPSFTVGMLAPRPCSWR